MGKENYEGFLVRQATLDDVDAIAEITHSAFIKYCELAGLETVAALKESKEAIMNDIENKLVLVAFLHDKVVGSARVEIKGDEAYFSRFGVSNEYQNLGIGKSLLNMVDIEMKKRGIKKLCLHTASKVASLIRFYYGRGFYIESTSNDRGYIRAYLVKDYK